jgi:hypothetical protein
LDNFVAVDLGQSVHDGYDCRRLARPMLAHRAVSRPPSMAYGRPARSRRVLTWPIQCAFAKDETRNH